MKYHSNSLPPHLSLAGIGYVVDRAVFVPAQPLLNPKAASKLCAPAQALAEAGRRDLLQASTAPGRLTVARANCAGLLTTSTTQGVGDLTKDNYGLKPPYQWSKNTTKCSGVET